MKKSTIIIIVIAVAAVAIFYFKFVRKPQPSATDAAWRQPEAGTFLNIPDEVLKQTAMFVEGEKLKYNGITYQRTSDNWVII